MRKIVHRLTYKMMYGFLLSQPESNVINLHDGQDCLACQTVFHFFGRRISATKDCKGRNEYDFFSSFSSSYSVGVEEIFVVPDGFVTFCKTVENPKQTVKQIKAELKKLSKKKLV